MARRREAKKRKISLDPKFENLLVSKFINSMMSDGEKSVAQKIFYAAIDLVENKTGKNGIEIFVSAIENVKPVLEVKSRRVGGANYQIPIEVLPQRSQTLAIRWIIQFTRTRHEKTMKERLAAELVDAFNKTGLSIKKREDTHRMAEANKAFAHYRW